MCKYNKIWRGVIICTGLTLKMLAALIKYFVWPISSYALFGQNRFW